MSLIIENLKILIKSNQGDVYPVDGLDLQLQRGQTFALVGESGCGKTMTSLAILQLLPAGASFHEDSKILFHNQNLLDLSAAELRAIRGRRISMIFQEPMSALNPVMTIGEQIAEVLKIHLHLSNQECRHKMRELLAEVGLADSERVLRSYPHQLSGGMKQRVCIAIAIAAEPEILIADEPTTALDVTIQAQILLLLRKLQQKTGMAMLLISHDLGVVKQLADDVAVMYAGHIVEQSSAASFFSQARHPYSDRLMASIPHLSQRDQPLSVIKGQVPDLHHRLLACRFEARCPYAWQTCREIAPRWLPLPADDNSATNAERWVRCHLYDPHYKETQPAIAPADRVEAGSQTESVDQDVGVVANKAPLQKIIEIRDLSVCFPAKSHFLQRRTADVKAVNGVSLQLYQGETLAIVGESGSGKTTLGRALLQLIPITAGDIYYREHSLRALSRQSLRHLRRELQIIFQDPFASLNPRMMVGDIIMEGMMACEVVRTKREATGLMGEILNQVGLPSTAVYRYPHEFSGGQRQRICIARALAVSPKVLVCDEPTSALDVSVQAQILNLLKELQARLGLSYLFISHNIAVVAYLADRVLVMRKGEVVEQGPVAQIIQNPQHPYTQELIAAVPWA